MRIPSQRDRKNTCPDRKCHRSASEKPQSEEAGKNRTDRLDLPVGRLARGRRRCRPWRCQNHDCADWRQLGYLGQCINGVAPMDLRLQPIPSQPHRLISRSMSVRRCRVVSAQQQGVDYQKCVASDEIHVARFKSLFSCMSNTDQDFGDMQNWRRDWPCRSLSCPRDTDGPSEQAPAGLVLHEGADF